MRVISTLKDMPKKAKIVWMAVVATILVFCMVSGYILAYLTKPVEPRVNNVTIGAIKIELSETQWDKLPNDEKTIYPGKELPKDPVVKNVSKTDNEAYAFVKITVPRRIVSLVQGTTILPKEDMDLFTYEVNSDWTQLGNSTISADGLSSENVYVYNKPLAKGESTTAVFETVRYQDVLEGEIAVNEKLSIKVDAFAIQKDYVPMVGGTFAEQANNLYNNYLKNA